MSTRRVQLNSSSAHVRSLVGSTVVPGRGMVPEGRPTRPFRGKFWRIRPAISFTDESEAKLPGTIHLQVRRDHSKCLSPLRIAHQQKSNFPSGSRPQKRIFLLPSHLTTYSTTKTANEQWPEKRKQRPISLAAFSTRVFCWKQCQTFIFSW